MNVKETQADGRRIPGAPTDEVGTPAGRASTEDPLDSAIRRIALILDCSPAVVGRNVPAALEKVLCSLPWESRLRRERDRVLLNDVRLLWAALQPDDLRRKRVLFLIEHAERRSRLGRP